MTTTLVFYSNCFGPADEAPEIPLMNHRDCDDDPGSHHLRRRYCYDGVGAGGDGVGLELHRTILSVLLLRHSDKSDHRF